MGMSALVVFVCLGVPRRSTSSFVTFVSFVVSISFGIGIWSFRASAAVSRLQSPRPLNTTRAKTRCGAKEGR
jgi:hypothetical protein